MINQLGIAFNECSAEIKRMMINQPDVSVDMLTNWLLQNLPEKTSRIKYKKSTHSDENLYAVPDWEWWFVLSDKTSFAARIHAKKLDASADNYPILFSVVDGKRQIEELTERNTNDGFASMYVLYSINDHNSSICKNGKTNDGIFWGEANKFRNDFFINGQRSLSSPNILSISTPVSCILCCPGIYGEGMDIEQGFRQHIGHYFPQISEKGNAGFRDTPKDIVDLLESESMPDGWNSPGSSKEILVIDLRSERVA